MIAVSLNNMGEAARYQGDYPRARTLLEESLSLKQALGDERGIGNSLSNLGNVAQHQHDHERAETLFKESLSIHRKLENKVGIVDCLTGLATVARKRPERSTRLLAAAGALLDTMGASLSKAGRVEYERQMAFAGAELSAEAFSSAWAEGRAMTLEQAIEYALAGQTG